MIASPATSFECDAHSEAESGRLLQGFMRIIRAMGRPCVICLRISLQPRDIENLLALPEVVSIILMAEDRDLLETFPGRIGYYTSNGIDWKLPARMADELLYVGSWTEFGARAAIRAWRAGVRGICIPGIDLGHRQPLPVVIARKLLQSLLYRIERLSLYGGDVTRRHKGLIFRIKQFLYARRVQKIKPPAISCGRSSYHQGRIVVAGASLGPGGGERQLVATLSGLVAHGFKDVHFLHHWPMQRPNDFYLPTLVELGIPYSQLTPFAAGDELSAELTSALAHTLMPLGDLGVDIGAYAKEFLVRRPEVAHIWQDQMNVTAGLAALLAGVPRIYLSCRSLSPTHFSFNQPYMRPIYRLLARFPNVVFLNNSEAGARDYSRWLGMDAARIRVIHNGFDHEGLPPPERLVELRMEYRKRLGIPPEAPVVGVVLRISEEKRPRLWLQIAQSISERLPNARFLVVGDGPMRDEIEAIAARTLPGKIYFPGHERNAIMAIAAMDLFLLTSRTEGLPNVLIEAQAVGVPPVAIDVGGAGEALLAEETGWLANSDTPEAVANKVVSVLSDRECLERASQKGPKFVQERFNWGRMIQETLLAYGYGVSRDGAGADAG